MRRSERILSAARSFGLAAVFALGATSGHAGAPEKVVSINLCTDQLALMLAAPGQLISVSRLAHDPQSSAMAEAARALPTNGSGAEEIYLLDPDLVLAGTFTAPATVNMLRNLGIPVVQFAPARALSDVPERLLKMGEALGRTAQAEAMVARYQSTLSELSAPIAGPRPRAVITYVNSYSSGDATLAGDILRAAGFDNAATELGLSSVGTVSLEELVLLAPDVIVQGRDYPGVSRAEDNLHHPALHALKDTHVSDEITDRDWICGTPQVLNAVRAMRQLRDNLEAAR